MAIAGVDTQGGNQFAALQNVAQQNRPDETRDAQETRAQESQEARFGQSDTTETEERQERLGTDTGIGPQQGSGVPGTSLGSESLSALIQATQEQDIQAPGTPGASDGTEEADDETRQQQAAAGNSTNSLAPGTTAGVADGSADSRGVSLLV